MSKFIRNAPISCDRCGCDCVNGKQSEKTASDGTRVLECKWICPVCSTLLRKDEKRIETK